MTDVLTSDHIASVSLADADKDPQGFANELGRSFVDYGFAVIRDPIACKPAVIAETDDWVAMASEYRAIAPLPSVENAKIWEPAPATVYAWSRAA